MNKATQLRKIAEEIENCEICKKDKIGMAVPGEGSPDAKIIFIGEAPGKTEAATGRPFVGRSGKLLRSTILSIGLKEDEVYITSPVKYLPVYKTPTERDILHGMIHLSKQLAVIKPKIVVLMGSVAARGVLGEKIPVAKEHGKILIRNGVKYFFSYHPAAAIRFQKFKQVFIDDFKKLKTLANSNS